MSGITLRRPSFRSRLGFGPQIRSSVRQLHWCGPTAFSTRSGPPHIGRTCAPSLWLGRAHDGLHCSGSGQGQTRGATTTAHLHFPHRCLLGVVRTSLRVATVERLGSRRGVQSHGRARERLLGGHRTCCTETQGKLNSLLQTFDGL